MNPDVRARLPLLDAALADVAARVTDARPGWPCRRGCDDCCRALAAPMRVSRAEWARLAEAIAALAPEIRDAALARLDRRACALLDEVTGACRVYAARPLVCRAHGFHLGRDGGRWCAKIEADPALTEGVLLGNHDAFERALEALGEARSLGEWLALDRGRLVP